MLCHHVSHARGFPECYPDITAGVRSCENTSEKWGLMSIFSAVHFLAIRCHLICHAGPFILKWFLILYGLSPTRQAVTWWSCQWDFLWCYFLQQCPARGLKKKKNASCCHPMGAKELGTCCESACKPNCIRRNPFKLIDSRTGVNISNTVTLWRVTSSIKPLQVIFLSPGQRADLPEVPLDGLKHVRHLLTDTTKYTISVLGWTIHSAVGQ